MRILTSILLHFCIIVGAYSEQPQQPAGLRLGLSSLRIETNESVSKPPSQKQYVIRQIKFEGARILTRKQLSELIGIKPGQDFQISALKTGLENILSEYRRKGLFFTKLEPQFDYPMKPGDFWRDRATPLPAETEKANALGGKVGVSEGKGDNLSQVIIKIQIREGKRLKIGKIAFGDNTMFTEADLKDEIRLQEGALFSEERFSEGVERILRLYSEHGHPKVNISPVDFELGAERETLNLRLKVDEGPVVKITQVRVEGLQKTRQHVLLRELPLREGDIFDQRKIDQSFRTLNNLGFFYEVNPNLLQEGAKPDEIIFNARVTEARTGRFNGVLGYAPPANVGEEAQWTGLIQASEANLFGTGRRVNFLWKPGPMEVYELGYEEPWAFGKPVRIGLEIGNIKQTDRITNTVSKERAGSLIIGAKLMEHLSGSLTVTYKRIDVPAISLNQWQPEIGTPIAEIPEGDYASGESQSGVKYGITFGLQRDSRDFFLNPTKGRLDKIAVEISKGDFKIKKVWFDMNQYFKTLNKQVIAIGLHAALASGNNIPPTELFYLGGANTLRGYNEGWFRGVRRLHSNLEYRLLIGRTSQVFLFLDAGAISQIDTPNNFAPIRLGYGFGIRLESKGGLVNMDYGLAKGESALEGKIHFSFGASF